MSKPLLLCLIGLPALGKSTWRSKYLFNHDFNGFVASTDDIIDEIAEQTGATYNDAFRASIQSATQLWNKIIDIALKNRKDLIVDRTNLTKKSRKEYLRRAKNAGYDCRAIVFQQPVNSEDQLDWETRLQSRPGKIIPPIVLEDMKKKYEAPTVDEGFNTIGVVDTFTFPNMVQIVNEY